ncbi:Stp1/IreP family PP2C-type Ser/Thr phosphatase [Caldibacillus lycopersici]|uniref:protein-serine/threonine phosphatase n=1 Tax=Perspicuibacillus lycopersici TaxID=1325689 RepID=A0AAE3IRN4_9BACI|nr:Stp1/IreP family PP2C-type Ser/Thr phosphatase [Perspicuibacillus lycopersici]MCU9612156.1 Stp1/IreP family PP2C-type Ser/Thr phosphatase [Perspicuibacillus lycopersici]
MKSVFRTDCGRIRTHNEDFVSIFSNQSGELLAMVADGMGGHLAGDVASRMTSELLQKRWEEANQIDTPEKAEQWFLKHVVEINDEVLQYANEHEECRGMGTTIVAAICNDKFATVANVGDSRCYVMNENGFYQLTDDHSLVNELVKSGQLSKEDAEHHPRKNVLSRALGTEPQVEVDIKTITFEDGDLLLLCSDGLSNRVTDTEMSGILLTDDSLEEKATHLIALANDNGGEDNISLAIVHNILAEKAGD